MAMEPPAPPPFSVLEALIIRVLSNRRFRRMWIRLGGPQLTVKTPPRRLPDGSIVEVCMVLERRPF